MRCSSYRFRERDSIEDEFRLFGGGKQRDPNGVKIIPGQTSNKPGAAASFKPYNTLSRGVKSSGPVRASGKEAFFSSQNRSKAFAGSPERSSKRRRVEIPEEQTKRVTTPDDESGPDSENHKLDKGAKDPKKSASYADRLSSEDQVLVSFTRDAAKERRRESGGFDKVARKLPEQSSNLSGETVKKQSIFDDQVTITPPPHQAGKSRPSCSRESPDELQGDVTVGPVPTSLGKYSKTADIQPTVFISNEKTKRGHKNKKWKASKKGLPAPQSFKIFYYRRGASLKDALGGENDQLIVDPSNDEFTVTIADSGIVHTISLQKVLKVLAGGRASRKVRFELSKVDRDDTKLDLELSTPKEKECLCSLLRVLKVEVQEKDEKYIDNAFKKSEREYRRYQASTNGYKRPLQIEITQETPSKPSSGPMKRMKLSDALQDNDGGAAAQKSPERAARERTSPSRPAASPSQNSSSGHKSSPSSGTRQGIGVEIPVKKFYSDLRAPAHSTRSTARQEPTTLVCDDDDDIDEGAKNDSPQPALDDVDQKWNRKPLVYPRFGKKKAEVNAVDLERLAPHEFLNDNIIGFYIRFLEDHLQRCNAEAAKRVYFFNSYFFDTLTNSRRRTINYEGVEKWTRNVDLFSYDYIVVPINEAAHWYLAVICNLPYLEGIMKEDKPSAPPPLASGEVQEVPETPEPSQASEEAANSQPVKEENARQSLASMSLLEGKGSQGGSKSGDDEWPDREENPDIARAKLFDYSSQPQPDSQKAFESAGTPKKSRKAKRKSTTGMKYNTCQPIVITFDSLNQGRSSTISTLREYLFAEATSKRGIEINKSLIKGMTAKEIPEQPNFSDCGLYLLAYVEKFVQDPDVFVRKLLRKEMRSKEDWPPLRSGLLRSRLREFMESLYSEQEQLTKTQADESTLMVDQQPICYLLGTSATDEDKEKVEDEKAPQVQVQVERSPPPDTKTKKPPCTRDPSAEPNSSTPDKTDAEHNQSTTNAETQESVIFLDQESGPRTELPEPDGPPGHVKRVLVDVPDSQDKANPPPAEAAQGRRSFEPHTKRAGAVYVDDSDAEDVSQQQETSSGRRRVVQVQVNETPPGSPAAR
ncbi:hypothetical protein BDV06DRAFT_38903 [Aspergillus oleicola]